MSSELGTKEPTAAIYRVLTDFRLDQEFNSLDAQYDASEAYIRSQADAGWTLIKMRYEDGGFSGGSTDRPDHQMLLDGCQHARSMSSMSSTAAADEFPTAQPVDCSGIATSNLRANAVLRDPRNQVA
jgi:hypothetical protein